MVGLTRFILRHPWPILGVTAVVAALGIWQRTRLKQSQSLEELVVAGDPQRVAFERMQRDFGQDEVLAVAVEVENGTIYTPEALAAIDALVREISQVPGVGPVTGVTTTDRLEARGRLGLPQRRALYDAAAGEAGARAVRAYVQSHPLLDRRLVSPDGRSALLVVRFLGREPEKVNAATRRVRAVTDGFRRPGLRVWLAGVPLIRTELIDAVWKDVDRLLFVALGGILLVLAVAFRRVLPVVLGGMAIVLGVLVTEGVIAALGIRMNNLLAMVPALVLVIASSTSMHLLSRYRSERRRGADRQTAMARVLVHVGSGCFWSAATTGIAFGSLIVNRVPALRQCGYLSAMGVMLSFLLAMGFIPAILTLGRGRRPDYDLADSDLGAAVIISPVTEAISRFVRRFARLILVVAVIGAAVTFYGITRLRVETNRLDYFRPTDALRVAYEHIEGEFGGLTEVDVLVSGGREDWLTPEAVRRLEGLQAALERVPDVDSSLSLVSLLRHVNQAFGGAYELPADDVRLGAFFDLGTTFDREGWSRTFVSADRRATRIVLYTRLKGSAQLERLVADLGRAAEAHAVPGTQTAVTGSAALFAAMARYVVSGQVWGSAVVMGVLFVIMCLLVRRVTGGFLLLLPTLIPVLSLFGLMGFLGISLNLHTSIVSSLAAGMAIDNAIHFLNAFRREYRLTRDYGESVRLAIHIIGRPLIVNACLLTVGLGAFSQGKLLPVQQFGLLLAVTMVNALIMGIVLLPALMLVFRPRIGGSPAIRARR